MMARRAGSRGDAPTGTPPSSRGDGREGADYRMWGGRFGAGPEEAFDRLNRSLPVDYRLWPQDVRASRAWVHSLAAAGVLDRGEREKLVRGLDAVVDLLAKGAASDAPDEDVHTLVERLLFEQIGGLAGKLHTGRSRNDQVATDLRLWTIDALEAVDREVVALGRAVLNQAKAGVDLVVPGYTHGQRAQPIRWGFLMIAHAWPLVRDRQRLAQIGERVSHLPLGSGALAGSGVPVDRAQLQLELGFHRLSPNALDATGDRDFAAEALFALALIGTHVSRLAADLLTANSSEHGFVTLADGYSSGSSLMPQKRNPDAFEIARGKAARVLGDLAAFLAMLKGLPAGYSKDLQEDKALLFDGVDAVLLTLPAVRGAVATMEPNGDRMRAALDPSMLATDIADGLVARGIPFREAHSLVGRLVRSSEELGVAVTEVPEAASRDIHEDIPGVVAALGTWEDSVERRSTVGGSSRASVLDQIQAVEAELQAEWSLG